MSILNALKLRSSQAKKPRKNLVFHPDCATRHASLITMYLSGAAIEVLNPDGDWEDCENPVFDPQYDYRAKVTMPEITKADVIVRTDGAPKSTFVNEYSVPKAQVGDSSYSTGSIYRNAYGAEYLVLANKYQLIPDYNPTNDPDSGPLVVMRMNGKKPVVNCRELDGTRNGHRTKYNLGSNYLRSQPMSSAISHGDLLLIYRRAGAKDVYLRKDTGEVVFR